MHQICERCYDYSTENKNDYYLIKKEKVKQSSLLIIFVA